MTNENMIKQLKRLIPSLKYADDVNAVKGAIKALSQGPRYWIGKDGIVHKLVTMELVPDVVSRQAVIEIVNDIRDCISVDGYLAILERLKKLPSFTHKSDVLNKIRDEIKALDTDCHVVYAIAIDDVLQIIDRYKAEIEPQGRSE